MLDFTHGHPGSLAFNQANVAQKEKVGRGLMSQSQQRAELSSDPSTRLPDLRLKGLSVLKAQEAPKSPPSHPRGIGASSVPPRKPATPTRHDCHPILRCVVSTSPV